MPQFLGCFVKCFYFVWSKSISACQKCPGEGVSIAVPTRCAVGMAKVGMGMATGWRIVGNVKVMASSENRSFKRAVAYGMSEITILPSLRQFHRRPSWLVYQRENECLGIISITGAHAVTCCHCWENNKWKGLACKDFVQKLEFIKARKYTDSTRNSLTLLAKISNSWKVCF